tara:strand:+ start:1623 stop:2408 length:786 start_codon:yes stop_codon:yes gene_type:complete
MNVCYYYQTFVGLDKMMSHPEDVTHIIVSSIHFGEDKDGEKNIYLNDNLPNDKIFDKLWKETEEISKKGVKIMCMMGGAGGAYKELFSDYSTYFPLLVNMIRSKPWIQGIDIDIEEIVDLQDVKMLINSITAEFGDDFIITMAPVSLSMESDGSFTETHQGFGYKELYNSEEGKYINWFNCQCYYSYTYETFKKIVDNGYPPNKIIMGMESGQFSDLSFIDEIKKIKKDYPDMCGVYDWEYLNAPPDKNDPSEWARLMSKI